MGTNLVALFSEQIQRCIAKITFNYLAKVKDAEFVLHSDFDDIRAYIRYGTKKGGVIWPLRMEVNAILLENPD